MFTTFILSFIIPISIQWGIRKPVRLKLHKQSFVMICHMTRGGHSTILYTFFFGAKIFNNFQPFKKCMQNFQQGLTAAAELCNQRRKSDHKYRETYQDSSRGIKVSDLRSQFIRFADLWGKMCFEIHAWVSQVASAILLN